MQNVSEIFKVMVEHLNKIQKYWVLGVKIPSSKLEFIKS